MGQCYIFTKKQFLEQMEKLIDGEAVIFSTIKQGVVSGASKKKLKSFEVAFSNDCFKNSETISDLIGSLTAGMILLKKEYWSEDIKNFMEKEKT